MDETEFDQFAAEYEQIHAANISASGESAEFFAEYKVRDAAAVAKAQGFPESLQILDFGAGVGNSVPYFRKHLNGGSLTCLDVSRKSLALGERRFAGDASFAHFDGTTIPFPDDEFHMVFIACVFHHIPHEEHASLLKEMLRVLQPGGALVLFEHNPLNPLTVRAVNTCPFDENAVLICAGKLKDRVDGAGFARSEIRYRIFFPGALRALRPLERFLTSVPIGAQYYVLANKPV